MRRRNPNPRPLVVRMGLGGRGDLFFQSDSNVVASFGVSTYVRVKVNYMSDGRLEFEYRFQVNKVGTAVTTGINSAEGEVKIGPVGGTLTSIGTLRPLSDPDDGSPVGERSYEDSILSGVVTLPIDVSVYGRIYGGVNSNTRTVISEFTRIFTVRAPVPGLNAIRTSSSNPIMFLLPPVTNGSSPLYIFKHVAGARDVIIQPTSNLSIDGVADPWIYLNEANGCVTLFSQSPSWFIANYYNGLLNPGNGIATWPSPLPARKHFFARAGQVNVFRTDICGERATGDNYCILPDPVTSAGKMTFVVYGGDTSDKSDGNGLVISTADGSYIDTNSGAPFIYLNEGGASFKCVGAIFMSDGARWYAIGNVPGVYGTSWSFDTTARATTNLTIGTRQTNLYVVPDNVSGRHVALPAFSATTGTNSVISIVKAQRLNGGGLYIYANQGNTGVNRINDSVYRYDSTWWQQDWQCIWMVSEKRPGENSYHYYPVAVYYGS
jgi:hypothetical protein